MFVVGPPGDSNPEPAQLGVSCSTRRCHPLQPSTRRPGGEIVVMSGAGDRKGREIGETDARDSCLHSCFSESVSTIVRPLVPMNGVPPTLGSQACLGSYAYRSASATRAFGSFEDEILMRIGYPTGLKTGVGREVKRAAPRNIARPCGRSLLLRADRILAGPERASQRSGGASSLIERSAPCTPDGCALDSPRFKTDGTGIVKLSYVEMRGAGRGFVWPPSRTTLLEAPPRT